MAAKLNASPRERTGKGAARTLRRAGRVPGVIYGHGDATRSVALDALELEKLLATISVENTLIELSVEGAETVRSLIREVQWHPYRREALHVDFYQVHAGEKIHLQVPIRLLGNPLGVREHSGVLQHVLHDLEVECLPKDIPEALEVDVSGLQIGDSLHVSDLSATDVKILTDGAVVICTVTGPTVSALPEDSETADGVGGDVEPELIRGHADDAKDVPFEHGSAQPE